VEISVRANDIVGLDALDHQHWQSHGADNGVNGLYLAPQLVRHGGAMGFVVRIDVIAECLALGIEHHRDVTVGIGLDQTADHVDHAFDGAGVLPPTGQEGRQRVKRSKQVRRPVYQNQLDGRWSDVIHVHFLELLS
jgi:hypothetical protein